MSNRYICLFLAVVCVVAFVSSLQAAVITVYPGTKVTPDGVEPAEWQLNDGWSIVTNKMGVGKIVASGPSLCEAQYEPFKAYELYNIASSPDFPRWSIVDPELVKYNLGRGAFYASCDRFYGQNTTATGKTPSTVWLGTDQHAGQPLAGIKLSQIKTMKYCSFVSGVPTLLAPGVADSSWDSWKGWWYNPRFPIQLQITVQDANGNREQFWYRPYGSDTFIGDCASDGRLSIWEEFDCIGYGRWLSPDYWEGNPTAQFNSWQDILAVYGDWTLVPTSTTYDLYNNQWKSVGFKGATEPPGMPYCTGTGKPINFEVGARFWRFITPSGEQRTWPPESLGFRGQMDYFTLEIDRNEDGDVNDPGESAVYDFEPAPDDPGPRVVYINQSCLNNATQRDTLIEKRGEPENQYDPAANPMKNTKEERLYDVIFKISGRVTERLNPYFVLDDGANLSLPTRVYCILNERWTDPPTANPAQVDQYWSSWGLLERFRPAGSAPYVDKPFIMWTSVGHDKRIQ